MKSIEAYIISEDRTIIEAMDVINNNARGVVYVCSGLRLRGVLTDGIIRRHIMHGGQLEALVGQVMNAEPRYLRHSDSADPYEYMEEIGITSVPILNENKEILSIKFLHASSIHATHDLNVPVVIMAGGKGTRLLPLTQVLPKPLVTVDDRTITEIIMDQFSQFGCRQFDMIVNYKKALIKAFFADFDKDYDITFTDEQEFLGTGGGIKLLEGKYDDSFFLTNCDILIEEDYGDILRKHRKDQDIITIVCAVKTFTVPYGTVEVDDRGCVRAFVEKPSQTHMVNTGLYVINPRFLDYIPANKFIHITSVIERCIESGEKVGIYPVQAGNWWDMGQMKELEKMRNGFQRKKEI